MASSRKWLMAWNPTVIIDAIATSSNAIPGIFFHGRFAVVLPNIKFSRWLRISGLTQVTAGMKIKFTDANRILTVGRRSSRTQASIPQLNKREVGTEAAASKHAKYWLDLQE